MIGDQFLTYKEFALFVQNLNLRISNLSITGAGAEVPIHIPDHNDLEGIQGGVAGEYYHFALASEFDYAKFTASGLEGRNYAEVLSDLSGQAAAAFSWNSQDLTAVGNITVGNDKWIGTGAAGPRLVFDSGNSYIEVQGGDIFTDRWLSRETNTFFGIDVIGAGNLAHVSGSDGYYNSVFGRQAGYSCTKGYLNVLMGYQAGYFLTIGKKNTCVGANANYLSEGDENVTIGYMAGYGGANGSLATGSYNVYVGVETGVAIWAGDYNVIVGYKTGHYVESAEKSVILGARAGYNVNSGKNNILVGYQAGDNITIGSDNIIIGHDIDALLATGDDQLRIGSAIYGNLTAGAIKINFAGLLTRKFIVTTNDVDGNETHLIAVLLGGLIRRGTGDQLTAARTDVTDTAANIVAAIKGCIVGSGFEFLIANEDSTHTVSLDGGVGVTMIPNDPSTAIPANSTGRFMLVVTNIGEGTEAVDIHLLGYSTH